MEDFNPQNVFNRRMAAPAINLQELDPANDMGGGKAFELRKVTSEALEAVKAASEQKIRDAGSWSSMVTDNPDGIFGTAVNFGASLVDGINKHLVTNIATALPGLETIISNSAIPNSVREAKSRLDAGTATDQDRSLLNQPAYENPDTDPSGKGYAQAQQNVPTYLEQLAGVERRSKAVSDIRKFMDTSSWVHRGDQQELAAQSGLAVQGGVDQMKQGFKAFRGSGNDLLEGTGDMAVGLAKTISQLPKLAYDNPKAVLEHVITNVPQIAAAIAGMGPRVATNFGYAASELQDAVTVYREKNNGAMPSLEWMVENTFKAITLLVAETAGDKFVVGGASALRGITAPIADAAQAGFNGMSRSAFKTALGGAATAAAPLARVGGAVVAGGLGEFGTEAYQTATEMEMKGETPTLEDAVQGGVIGALSGGTLSGGLAAGRELAGGAVAAANAIKARRGQTGDASDVIQTPMTPEQKTAFDAAVISGDASAYTNKSSPEYSPRNALNVLFQNTEREATTNEQRELNTQQAKEIVTALSQENEIVKTSLAEGKKTTPEELAELKETVLVVQQVIEATDPADTAKLNNLTNFVTDLQAQIDGTNPETLKIREAEVVKRTKEIRKAQSVYGMMNARMAAIPAEELSKEPTAVATRAINLSMASVSNMTPEAATEMADDATLQITDKQRSYLREFSAARIAENLAQTRNSVLDKLVNGDGGKNLGIADYRRNISQALAVGDVKEAARNIDLLSAFAEDHKNKFDFASDLLAKSRVDGKPYQMLWNKNERKWFVPDVAVDEEARIKNGGLNIQVGKSAGLVESIGIGASALAASLKEQEAAFGMTYDTKPAKESTESKAKKLIEEAKQAVAGTAETQPAAVPEVKAEQAVEQKAEEKGAVTETFPEGKVENADPAPVPLDSKLAEGIAAVEEYLNNPPESYTPAKAKLRVDRANKLLPRVIKERDAEESGSARFEELDAMASTLRRIIAKGNEMTEADAYLEESLGNQGESKSDPVSEEKPGEEVTEDAADASAVAQSEVASTEEQKVEAEPELEAGKLVVMAKKSKKDRPYRQRNLIADFFNQSGATKPLFAVKDFLSQWVAGKVSPLDFLKATSLTEQQSKALEMFKTLASKWQIRYQKDFAKRLPSIDVDGQEMTYGYRNMMQFLVERVTDDKGITTVQAEENIKTAMSLAAFNLILSEAGNPRFNKNETINKMLGQSDTLTVPREVRNLLSVGTNANLVRNALGKEVLQALGLSANKDAPADLQAKLESAVGAHVVKMLIDLGVLQRKIVKNTALAPYRRTPKDALEAGVVLETELVSKGELHLLALTRDANDSGKFAAKVESLVQEMREATQGSEGILSKLFSVESNVVEPGSKPIPYIQKVSKKGKTLVNSFLAKVLKEKNAEASYINMDLYKVLVSLAPEVALQIMGQKDTANGVSHVDTQRNKQSKNDGLVREYDNLRDFVEGKLTEGVDAIKQGIYFSHDMWSQGRVGIATTVLNPQTSKLHRHLLFRKSWETKVEFGSAMEDSFKLRAAEGLGLRPEQISADAQLGKAEKLINHSAIQKAIEVMQRALTSETEMAEADAAVLLLGIAQGGKNIHTFDAITALAQAANAREEGKTGFTSVLMGEIDGVTNGPMFTQLLLGIGSNVGSRMNTLNRGGFYSSGATLSQYNEWRSQPQAKDLYEDLAEAMIKSIRDSFTSSVPALQNVYRGIFRFTGELFDEASGDLGKDARGFVKKPLTAINFGSGKASILSGMADVFIEGIYTAIEDAAKNGDSITSIVDALNTLLVDKLPEDIQVADLLARSFSTQEINQIRNTFTNVLDDSIWGTMESKFSELISRRDALTQTANLAHAMYDSAYRAAKDALIKDLIAKGEWGVGKTGDSIRDISTDQEAAIRESIKDIQPVMQTGMSIQSGELETGLPVGKHKSRLSSPTKGGAQYASKVEFGSAYSDTKTSNTDTSGSVMVDEAPGVGVLPVLMHSFDSFVSHLAALGHEILNIHDALGTGLAGYVATALRLNKATWDASMIFSPASSVRDALFDTIKGMAAQLTAKDASPLTKQYLVKSLETLVLETNKRNKTKKLPPVSLNELLVLMAQEAALTAYEADKAKFETLAQLGSVDQYPAVGGNYVVTNENRAEAQAKLEALDGMIPADVFAALVTIQAELGYRTPKAQVREAVESVWGEVGTPKIAPEKKIETLVKAFDGKPVSAMMDSLLATLSRNKNSDANNFNIRLVKALGLAIPKGVTVRYVTAASSVDMDMGKPNGASRGWFITNDAGKSVIHILSSEHVDSGLTTELLVHEMLHAALSQIIAEAQATDGKPTPEAKELVKELEQILSAASKYVKDNNLEALYGEAVKNVDELVSWGMTNAGFQVDVMDKLVGETGTQGNALMRGSRALFEALTKFFFGTAVGSNKDRLTDGMYALISNVSGLLEQAQQMQASGQVATPKVRATNLSMATQDSLPNLKNYSTQDIFDAIEGLHSSSVSAEFNDKLKSLLKGIVNKIHGPFGAFKAALMEGQAISPEDVYAKAKQTGVAPFASESLNSGFRISEQEAFVMEQVEVTVLAALDNNSEGSASYDARGLKKLYEEARRTIEPKDFHDGDWATAPQIEKDKAEALHAFLFKVGANSSQYSDYLSRFAALGLAHEGVNKVLQGRTLDKPVNVNANPTIASRLIKAFNQMLEWIEEKRSKTYRGQSASGKLNTLVGNLVDIEGKRLNALKNTSRNAVFDQVTAAGNTGVEYVNKKIVDFATSPFVINMPSQTGKAVIGLGRVIAQGNTMQLLGALTALRDSVTEGKLGVVFGTLKDAIGAPELFQAMARGTKKLEQARKHASTQTSKIMREGFANKGKNLTPAIKTALTRVILRTGAFVLLDHFTDADLEGMLNNPAQLNKAIAAWEDKLKTFPTEIGQYYSNQSKALAFSLAWGEARGPNMMMNAENIASLLDTGRHTEVTKKQVLAATEIVDVLITLRAMSYNNANDLKRVGTVLRTEIARTDKQGNGLLNMLHGHRMMHEQAKQTLFKDSNVMMVKGYTSEIFNPYTDIQAVFDGEFDDEGNNKATLLTDAGYKATDVLQKDVNDPDARPRRLYIRKGGGLTKFQTSITSYTNKQAKGSETTNGDFSNASAEGAVNLANMTGMAAKKRTATADLFTKPYDPLEDKQKHAAAVRNEDGNVASYRYMMSNDLKDTLLERTNDFDTVMGAMAASTFDKETATEQNIRLVKASHDLYKLDYARNPKAYLEVGPNSTDPALRDIYRMFTYEMRQGIRSEWGSSTMMIRNDLLNISFGYRKYSLATIWDKKQEEKAHMEIAFTWFAEHAVEKFALLSGKSRAEAKQRVKRTAFIVQKSENVWQDVVSEIKDIVVVRTGVVTLANIYSNLWVLKLAGVSLVDMAKHHKTATVAAKDWMRDQAELFKLQADLASGYSTQTPAALKKQIAVVQDNLARNPVKELMEAGLMPTIVEDVTIEDSPYTYKAILARKVDKLAANFNPAVLKAAKQVYIARDTTMYKTMSEIAQLSDFVARYTLYTHLTTRAVDPMSKEDAIQRASDFFINYDIPQHRTVQYLDDTGLTPFMKYFIRIQRVIIALVKENPTRVLALMALDGLLDGPATVMDSSILANVGDNPVRFGALGYVGTLGDLATVNAAASIFRP